METQCSDTSNTIGSANATKQRSRAQANITHVLAVDLEQCFNDLVNLFGLANNQLRTTSSKPV